MYYYRQFVTAKGIYFAFKNFEIQFHAFIYVFQIN